MQGLLFTTVIFQSHVQMNLEWSYANIKYWSRNINIVNKTHAQDINIKSRVVEIRIIKNRKIARTVVLSGHCIIISILLQEESCSRNII